MIMPTILILLNINLIALSVHSQISNGFYTSTGEFLKTKNFVVTMKSLLNPTNRWYLVSISVLPEDGYNK